MVSRAALEELWRDYGCLNEPGDPYPVVPLASWDLPAPVPVFAMSADGYLAVTPPIFAPGKLGRGYYITHVPTGTLVSPEFGKFKEALARLRRIEGPCWRFRSGAEAIRRGLHVACCAILGKELKP